MRVRSRTNGITAAVGVSRRLTPALVLQARVLRGDEKVLETTLVT